MTENFKQFLELVSKEKELADKVNAMSKDEIIAYARELGIELTQADLNAPGAELSDDELEAVSGGNQCHCVLGGGGTTGVRSTYLPDGTVAITYNDEACACVAVGLGYEVTEHNDGTVNKSKRCTCVGAGVGVGVDGLY